MIVGSKQGFGLYFFLFMEVFSHRPSNAEAVKSARTPPNLVKQDQAFLCSVV